MPKGAVQYPKFEPPYEVNKFPLWSLAVYLERMRQLDPHRQKSEREVATQKLLSYLVRPANLFPLVRLIFPGVRISTCAACTLLCCACCGAGSHSGAMGLRASDLGVLPALHIHAPALLTTRELKR